MTTVRERIVAAAREGLARGDRPVVAEIIARAGVSKATFYRTFGSREGLFRELDVDPELDGRPAILEAAAELLARDGLARMSMDELAELAGVSRARLYRLYPGKAALFAEIVRTFSPIEVVVATMERLAGAPPETAMPELAVSIWRAVSTHLGVVRPLLFEVASLGPDVRDTIVGETMPKVLGALGSYLLGQMQEGRLRTMHPVLAIQSFAGPIIVHVLLRPVVTEALGMELDSEAAVREFAANWVRGMRPDVQGPVMPIDTPGA
jgi:AcrR family transcriptional regulator